MSRIVNILWELKLSSVSMVNRVIDFGVCALAGWMDFIITHKYSIGIC